MGRPDYILVNSEKPCDAAMRDTGTGFVVLSHHSLFNIKSFVHNTLQITFLLGA